MGRPPHIVFASISTSFYRLSHRLIREIDQYTPEDVLKFQLLSSTLEFVIRELLKVGRSGEPSPLLPMYRSSAITSRVFIRFYSFLELILFLTWEKRVYHSQFLVRGRKFEKPEPPPWGEVGRSGEPSPLLYPTSAITLRVLIRFW